MKMLKKNMRIKSVNSKIIPCVTNALNSNTILLNKKLIFEMLKFNSATHRVVHFCNIVKFNAFESGNFAKYDTECRFLCNNIGGPENSILQFYLINHLTICQMFRMIFLTIYFVRGCEICEDMRCKKTIPKVLNHRED